MSIYLGFPGIRQSRARAASDRLTSLEAQKEHSEQLHVQGVLCRDQHIPSCAAAMFQTLGRQVRAVQPLECAGQTATTLMDTQPGHTGLCYLYIPSLCGVKYRSHRYTVRVGGDNDTRNVPRYVSIHSQSSSNILHYIMVTRTLTHTFSFHIKYQVYLSGWHRQLFHNWSITLQGIKIRF